MLSNGGSANHIGLRFDGTASEENLPMGRSSPDREGARVCQHLCSPCPQNLCDFRKPDIVASQKTHCSRICVGAFEDTAPFTGSKMVLKTGVDSRFPAGVSIGSWSLSPGNVVSDSMSLVPPGMSTS